MGIVVGKQRAAARIPKHHNSLEAFFLAQILPSAARLQMLTVILGCPLLAVTAYQSDNPLAILSSDRIIYFREFAQFAFLFPLTGYSGGVFPRISHVVLANDPHLSLWRWAFVLMSLILLAAGIGSGRKSEVKPLSDTGRLSWRLWVVAAVVATLAILSLVFIVVRHPGTPNETLISSERMLVLPLVIALLAIGLQTYWERIISWSSSAFDNRFSNSDQSLVLVMIAVPFLILTLISFFKPIFNARGMLCLAPYMLLVLASGVVYLSRSPIVAVGLILAIGVAHYSGIASYREMSAGRADYKSLAMALTPRVDKQDLVFFRRSWYSSPVLYYMEPDWDRFVAHDYLALRRRNPGSRIWMLWFYNYERTVPSDMRFAVRGYKCLQTIDVSGAGAFQCDPPK